MWVKLPRAFILIDSEIGSGRELLKELRKIENIKEAYGIFGIYDIIVKIEAETMEKLKEIVAWKIRRLNNIRSTLTLMVMEGTTKHRLNI